jgi:hypothetical protein
MHGRMKVMPCFIQVFSKFNLLCSLIEGPISSYCYKSYDKNWKRHFPVSVDERCNGEVYNIISVSVFLCS